MTLKFALRLITVAVMVHAVTSRYLEASDRSSILQSDGTYDKHNWYRRNMAEWDTEGIQIMNYIKSENFDDYNAECIKAGIDKKACELIYAIIRGLMVFPMI